MDLHGANFQAFFEEKFRVCYERLLKFQILPGVSTAILFS